MIKKYLDFIMERKIHSGKDYEYGCILLYLSFPEFEKCTDLISGEDLYHPNEDRYGKECDPHVTIKYGTLPSVSDDQIKEIFNSVKLEDIDIKLDGISIFEGKDFDVVKFKVKSDKLTELNKELSKLPNADVHPQYNPHITIAYVNKGCGNKYVSDDINISNILKTSIVYSKPNGDKISLV